MIYVSRETEALLGEYARLLQTWNKTINLVSRADERHLQHRHFEDSLALVDYLPQGIGRLIDLGSGGGLPAIPLGIATGLHIDMVEADRRKAAFLRTALASLGLNGTVWCERAEVATVTPASCVTARALASLPDLLDLTNPLLLPGGTGLFLKGPLAGAEAQQAAHHWSMTIELLPSGHPQSVVTRITGLSRKPMLPRL